ncbi:transmembrane protein 107-like [Tetranychus urticae]|uniref:transmembrane protein 107-like n=1 Tax=Tetranychus urticae TaxID=32264 RepID=UPI00077BEC6E|nr:transmembrane protein 107-like [Tetranychus urticae]
MKLLDLISLRFIALIGHLVLLIDNLWNHDGSTRSCLRWDNSIASYNKKDVEFTISLSISIFLTLIETINFMIGVSMFCPMQCLLSLTAHGSGAFILFYYMMHVWECSLSWWILALTTLLPALTEIVIVIRALISKVI